MQRQLKHRLTLTTVLVVTMSAAQAWSSPLVPTDAPVVDERIAQVDADNDGVADVLQVSDDDEDGDGEAADRPADPLGDFSIAGSIGTSFALGSIVVPNAQTIDSVLMNFGVTGTYSFTPVISLSISMAFTKFVTPHGLVKQYEQRFQDIGFNFVHGSLYVIPGADINVAGYLTGTVPASDFSRAQGLRTRIGARLNFSRGFGNLSVAYGFAANKNFHKFTSIVLNATRRDIDVLARDGGAEAVAENRVATLTGVNSEWSVSHSVNVSYRWFQGFSTTIGFSFSDAWTYNADAITSDDEFVNDNAVVGRGRSQAMSGSLALNYSFLDHYSAGLRMSTTQLLLTADNSRVRFPWIDTQSGNLSYTTVGLNFSVSY